MTRHLLRAAVAAVAAVAALAAGCVAVAASCPDAFDVELDPPGPYIPRPRAAA